MCEENQKKTAEISGAVDLDVWLFIYSYYRVTNREELIEII